MIKAKFTSEQQPVRIVEDGNKVYVYICLNGVHGADVQDGVDGGQLAEEYIEYEYNEFVADKDSIDLDDVRNNPENYLDYTIPRITELEQLRADVDYLLMLNE